MRHYTTAFALLALLSLIWLTQPRPSHAQTPILVPGGRVQLVAPDAFGTTERVTARLERTSPDTLVVQRYKVDGQLGPLQSIPRSSVEAAYAWAAPNKRAAGLMGAAIGFAVVGAGLAAFASTTGDGGGEQGGLEGVAVVLGGAMIGAPLGAAIGYNMAPDRWVRVPVGTAQRLQIEPGLVRHRDGVGLALRLRL